MPDQVIMLMITSLQQNSEHCIRANLVWQAGTLSRAAAACSASPPITDTPITKTEKGLGTVQASDWRKCPPGNFNYCGELQTNLSSC